MLVLEEPPRVVAVDARPPVVPVAAGPSRVTTDVTMIGVGVSPLRVADGVTVTTDVAISVVEGCADEAVTTWVVTGGGALDGAGAADEGAGAADEGAGAAEDGGGAAEDAGGAADEAGGAADETGGAEDGAGAAELTGAADEAGGAADEGVLGGAAEDCATEGVDGSGATDEGAGAADVGAADGVTGWDDTATEGEAGEEGAANDCVGACEGETREMNVLAAVLPTDDMLMTARHADQAETSDKQRRRQQQGQECAAETQRQCEGEGASVSRAPAGLLSWFVPEFPLLAG